MEIVNFIFNGHFGFWDFVGCFLVLFLVVTIIKYIFDFIVELIHGKPSVYYFPEGTKITEKIKTPDNGKEKVDADVSMIVGDVSVRNNN